MQSSYDNRVSIADGFEGIIGKLEPVPCQDRIMAALLEMLHSRGASNSDWWNSKQLESIFEELEALR